MRRNFVFTLWSCCAVLLFAGCVTTLHSYKPKTPDEASIKKLLLTWESTWNNHDVNGNLALYNAKAQIMYGKDRNIATKAEYAKILPERMSAHPSIKLGAPSIKVSGDRADALVKMSIGNHQSSITFHLVKEHGRWSIISWEY